MTLTETSLPSVADYPLPTAAELPAGRVGWKLRVDRAVVLLHDLQDHFLDAYGERSALREELLRNVSRIREAAAGVGVPVVYTAQPAQQDPVERALLTDFWGDGIGRRPHRAGISDRVAPRAGDTILPKWRYSAFQRSTLAQDLHRAGRDQLIVTGVYASIGVQVSACEAFMRDVQPFVVGDAVADFDQTRHRGSLEWVAATCGVVTSTAAVLGALA